MNGGERRFSILFDSQESECPSSGNFQTNWLSESRLCKQMSVDFVARAVEPRSTRSSSAGEKGKEKVTRRIPRERYDGKEIRRSFRGPLPQEPDSITLYQLPVNLLPRATYVTDSGE